MNDAVEKVLEHIFAKSDFVYSPEPTEPFGCVYFTGWKYKPDGINLVSQIVWWPPRSSCMFPFGESGVVEEYYCVNLPNMSVGKYKVGDVLDIETRNGDYGDIVPYRLGLDLEENKLHREHRYTMFREGVIQLVDFVIQDNPEWLQRAITDPVLSRRLYLGDTPRGAVNEITLQDRVVAAADVLMKEFKGSSDPSAVKGEIDNCYQLARESGIKPTLFALQFLSRSLSLFQGFQKGVESGVTPIGLPSPNLEWGDKD